MSARDFMGSGGLVSTSYADAEDADPRVGLVNLADVMLVFACGLMLALVSFWNLDISRMTEVMEADEMAEVEGIEDMEDQLGEGGANFTQLGMVYQDPMTGKMYMLKEDVGDSDGSGNADSAGNESKGSNGASAADSSKRESGNANGANSADSDKNESWESL